MKSQEFVLFEEPFPIKKKVPTHVQMKSVDKKLPPRGHFRGRRHLGAMVLESEKFAKEDWQMKKSSLFTRDIHHISFKDFGIDEMIEHYLANYVAKHGKEVKK